MSGIALLERVHEDHPELPIIVITAHSDLDNAVAAYKGGAFEYLPKPFDIDEAVDLVRKAARETAGSAPIDEAAAGSIPSLIGQAPAMQEVFRSIGRLSGSSMTVLITGESGTGKELVARALHEHSPRADKPFVALNTSAIASELLESELFGHEKGAFTGADARRIGRFEQADGGTLFLDEIGDMSPALQTRLLRVLAESEFYRVGGQRSIRVDVRVIAATNQNLARAVKEARFREDLYHRLNVIRINTPPLRQRREDIALLINHYLAKAADELRTSPKAIDGEALEVLEAYDWPGNVRQLVNATRRLTVTAPGSVITAEDIPPDFGGQEVGDRKTSEWTQSLESWAVQSLSNGETPLLDTALPEFERVLIRTAMARTKGHRQAAAKLLGWGRNTLARKMKALHLD
jgi:two-component system nitrogen regulation response regulator GlnG